MLPLTVQSNWPTFTFLLNRSKSFLVKVYEKWSISTPNMSKVASKTESVRSLNESNKQTTIKIIKEVTNTMK